VTAVPEEADESVSSCVAVSWKRAAATASGETTTPTCTSSGQAPASPQSARASIVTESASRPALSEV